MKWKLAIRGRYLAASRVEGVTYLISHFGARRWRLLVLVANEAGTDLISSDDYRTLDDAKGAASVVEKEGPPERGALDNPPPTPGELLAEAVYSIEYRHADDGEDYVHEFDEPEEVKIVETGSDRRALLLGDGMDILDTIEVDS